jgi:uncharacterized protein
MNDTSELFSAHFEELDLKLRENAGGTGLAETHGMACGLLCSRRSGVENWHALIGEPAKREDIQRVLDGVFSLARQSLESAGFEFRPLLPGDHVSIPRRVESIADWCSGFILAFALGESHPSGDHVSEALDDLRALAEMIPDDNDSQTQQRNLTEIEEYIRVATQLIFDESDITPPSQDPVTVTT